MKFQVLSRENARLYSYEKDIDRCIIVSINGTDEELNRFADNSAIKYFHAASGIRISFSHTVSGSAYGWIYTEDDHFTS